MFVYSIKVSKSCSLNISATLCFKWIQKLIFPRKKQVKEWSNLSQKTLI